MRIKNFITNCLRAFEKASFLGSNREDHNLLRQFLHIFDHI